MDQPGQGRRLRIGVRFGVLDSNPERIAAIRPKAQIEVVDFAGERVSRCKVASNLGQNSIQVGDSIYSPTWRPGRQVKLALIGKMDLDGDGMDDRAKVKALIEDAGGAVTLDLPTNGEATGKLTEDTSWLVLGEEVKQLEQWKKVESEARRQGISTISLDKLLNFLGGPLK